MSATNESCWCDVNVRTALSVVRRLQIVQPGFCGTATTGRPAVSVEWAFRCLPTCQSQTLTRGRPTS
jgi:hypothetical protein